MTTTFNPSDAGPSIVLSGGNLTVTGGATRLDNGVRTVNTVTAKHYFEWVPSAIGDDTDVGVCSGSVSLGTDTFYAGSDTQSIGFGFAGSTNVQLNNASVGTMNAALAAGDVLQVAIDVPNNLIWFKINSGNWNNSGTANPATGTGGYSFGTAFTGGVYVFAHTPSNLGAGTARFASGSWTAGAPSGFTEINPATAADESIANDTRFTEYPIGYDWIQYYRAATDPTFLTPANNVEQNPITNSTYLTAGWFEAAADLWHAGYNPADFWINEGGVDGTVTFAISEAPDTAAFSLSVVSTSDLAATETPDTASVATTVITPTSLSATEAPDTAAVSVAGATSISLASTEAPDTAAISASTALAAFDSGAFDNLGFFTNTNINWSLAATETADAAAIAITVRTSASIAATETTDTAALSVSATTLFTLATTETADAAVINVLVRTTATLGVTELPDVAAILAGGALQLSVAASEAQDVAALSVFTSATASFAAVETVDVASIAVTFVQPPISGTLATTEGADLAQLSGFSYTPVYYVDTEILRVDYERRSFLIPAENRVVVMPAKTPVQGFVIMIQPENRFFVLPPKPPTSSGLDYPSRANTEARRRV